MAQLPASHGSWVPRSGCKCVGSGTWHVQPESFACAGHVRIARYCACLRFGVQGAGVGSVDGLDLERSTSSTSRYRCATEYVKYAHESSVNKSKSARIQTQDTAQKCSCCFPTHVCQSLHLRWLETPRIVELRRLASQIQPQPTHPSVHRADSERATMAAVH